MCLCLGGLSVCDFWKVLMKTGLVLVVLGHVSFITAPLLHGTVLYYVGYCTVTILSVTSSIVVITSGIAAIMLSRHLPSTPLRWMVFNWSVACALLSLTCALVLLASIAVTFATQGQALPELLALTPDCPFDPISSVCLWAVTLVLCMVESVFAVRCTQLAHQLLEPSIHHVIPESPEPVGDQDLLSCTSSELLTI
uniref:Transmembrane protein 54 n=1 Tax=Microcebus murinus TaxID=30608 RepID=A0A8C5VXS4_MICMU